MSKLGIFLVWVLRHKFYFNSNSGPVCGALALVDTIPEMSFSPKSLPQISRKCPPPDSPYKYENSEVNIHYKTPVRVEQKEHIPDDELVRRQEEHMERVYEQERRKKYLSELEDIERRRHTDNWT